MIFTLLEGLILNKLRQLAINFIINTLKPELEAYALQEMRNLMTKFECQGQFTIDTERVGKGLDFQVPLPKVGDPGAHAFDLYTPVDVYLAAGTSANIPIGRKFKLPLGYGAVLWSRSGMAAKLGIERGAGLIDASFADEWIVVLRNHSQTSQSFKAGDRICQAFL